MNIRSRYWWLAAEVAAKLLRARELGFYVVGLCTPEGPTSQADPVLIASRDVPVGRCRYGRHRRREAHCADTVACHLPTI